MKKCALAVSALALAVSQVNAGTEPFFTPLTESTTVMPPNDVNELTSPWTAPPEFKFSILTSMREAERSVSESIVRADVAAAGRDANIASMFDMLAYSPDGRYLFIPHETPVQAGVSRYTPNTDMVSVMFMGDGGGANGDWSNDFGAFDPARVSPNETVWLAEEWAGTGRVIELLDPYGKPPANPVAGQGEVDDNWRVLDAFPLVAQEGIGFSNVWENEVVYFIDENNSGSIYKMHWDTPGDYSSGNVYVLQVMDCACDAAASWNEQSADAVRVGNATWVPLTTANRTPVSEVSNDPFNEAFGGRTAADDVGGTPYGRPEDVEVGTLASGNEVLYFTATSENSVYSVEMLDSMNAVVRLFASDDETPKNAGFASTTGELNAPDNLAQDALGNIFIIEDNPNTTTVGETGGDVWFARDVDNDGVAESVDHMLSLGVNQSEATGMVFNPRRPNEFAIAVQHPASTNLELVPDGQGDAVWSVKIRRTPNSAAYRNALREAQ